MISLYALHDRFIVQSKDHQQQYLQIYRQSAKVQVADGPLDLHLVANVSSQHSFGIIGVIQLLAGKYLLHVTNAEIVSSVMGYAVYKVNSIAIIPFSTRRIQDDLPDEIARTEESLYIDMIRSVLTSSSFHFSYLFDLTNSIQRISAMSLSKPGGSQLPDLIISADPRFFWNRNLLLDLRSVPASPWAVVLVSGFFHCAHFAINNHEFQYALFSRRSCLNAGKRFTRRGVDSNGDPTNFAEQEQIVCCKAANSDVMNVSSFIQTRGSVPLLWSQEACLKWAPPLHISVNSESKSLLEKHLSNHASLYGRTILVNLVNQCGREAIVATALSDCIPPYCPNSEDRYSLVSFDFHRKCKNMKYENIQLLLDEVKDHLQQMSFFYGSIDISGTWTVHQNQNGCFRTNCMDCLDRTNVVQSAIAKSVLSAQLQCCNIFNEGTVQESSPFYSTFREIWADNADVMSVLYSGTDALKTDYTRTGRRSIFGACNDGKNSVMRFYLNNFRDGYNQDGLDLFLGNYQVIPINKSTDLPYAKSHNQDGFSALFNYVVSRSFLIFISTLLLSATMPTGVRPTLSNVFALSMLVGPLLSLTMAQQEGRRFVDKPKLLPLRGTLSDHFEESISSNLSSLKSE